MNFLDMQAVDPDPLLSISHAITGFKAGQWFVGSLAINQLLIWALKKYGKEFLKRWNVTFNAIFAASAIALTMMVGGVPWYEAVLVSMSSLGPDFIHQTIKNVKGAGK